MAISPYTPSNRPSVCGHEHWWGKGFFCTAPGSARRFWLSCPRRSPGGLWRRRYCPPFSRPPLRTDGPSNASWRRSRAAALQSTGASTSGAPIVSPRRSLTRAGVLGACSVSGSDPEIVGSRLPQLATRVVGAAEEISRRMGYVPVRPALQVVGKTSRTPRYAGVTRSRRRAPTERSQKTARSNAATVARPGACDPPWKRRGRFSRGRVSTAGPERFWGHRHERSRA